MCEFRQAAGGGHIVLCSGRRICKIKDDALMCEATDVRRNAAILETLGVSRMMCVVETEEQLFDLIRWSGLKEFRKIKLDCYCYVSVSKLRQALHDAGMFPYVVSVDISATNEMPNALLAELLDLFPDIERASILGRSFER
jgi:hypothetical protein